MMLRILVLLTITANASLTSELRGGEGAYSHKYAYDANDNRTKQTTIADGQTPILEAEHANFVDYANDELTLNVEIENDSVNISIAEDGFAVPPIHVITQRPLNGNYGLEVRTTSSNVSIAGYFDDFKWVTTSTGSVATIKNFTYNSVNQLTKITGSESATYTYDDIGRLTQNITNGIKNQYAYDRLDRLTTLTTHAQTAQAELNTYTYYGSSWMRKSAQVGAQAATSYLHDGFACVAQSTAGMTTNYFVPGSQPLWEQTNGQTLVYANDGRGNVTGLWDGNKYATKFNYDAFGNVKTLVPDGLGNYVAAKNTSGPRYGGQFYDASTDQVYLRNRYYSPGTGRFNTMDPIGSSGGHNLYGYCGGDPVNRIDPMGTDYVYVSGGYVYYQGQSRSWGMNWDEGKPIAIGTTDGTWINLFKGVGGGIAHQATLSKIASDLPRGAATIPGVTGVINDSRGESYSDTPKLDRAIGAAKAGLEIPRIIKDTSYAAGYYAMHGEQATSKDFARDVGSSNEVFGESMLYSSVTEQFDKGKTAGQIRKDLAINLPLRTNPITGLGYAVADITVGEDTGDYERAGGGYLALASLPVAKAVSTVKTGGFRGLTGEMTSAAKATTTVFRQGTFADEAIGWKGNFVKGKQWATDNPLTTPNYAQKYGLPAENTANSPLKKGQKTLPDFMLFVGIADTIVRAGRSEFNGDGRRPQ